MTGDAPAVHDATDDRPRRTVLATIAGIALGVLGTIGLLFGLLFLVSAASLSGRPPAGLPDDAAAQAFATFGVILAIGGTAYLAAGIAVLRSHAWGRWLGVAIGAVGALFWAYVLVGSLEGGLGFALTMLALHVSIALVLAVRWRERPAG